MELSWCAVLPNSKHWHKRNKGNQSQEFLFWSKTWTYRSLDKSRAGNSHGFDRLKHINDLLNLQTFKYWVKRTERSTATKTVTKKYRNTKLNLLKQRITRTKVNNKAMSHFTTPCFVVRPLNRSETRVDFVVIQTLPLLKYSVVILLSY